MKKVTTLLTCLSMMLVSSSTLAQSDIKPSGKHIINGTPASPGEFPQFVAFSDGGDYKGHICGGVLITPRWALTAAHCTTRFDIHKTKVMVALESYSPLVVKDQVSIEKFIPEPRFDISNAKISGMYDIALVKLSRDAKGGQLANIDGVTDNNGPDPSLKDIPLTAIGFGLTENNDRPYILYKVQESVYPDEDCINVPPGYPKTNYNPAMNICAGYGVAGGDSGGPLFAEANGKKYVVGLVSRSLIKPAEEFTRVRYYANWLKETMEKE
ncbi:serine protease [Apirhabdus apintestini]|nr:serine protease [Enterobacteriaceae bacterium CA-0114]